MTSKERVICALKHKSPDRLPVNFEAVEIVKTSLMKKYSFDNIEKLYNHFEIDIREVAPSYIGKPMKSWSKGADNYFESYYGCEVVQKFTGSEYHTVVSKYPFNAETTAEEIAKFKFMSPDDFDYDSIKPHLEKHKDKAIIFGHEGAFQISTFLMSMDDLFVKMAMEEEVAHALFNKFVSFELEYYERILIAGDGQIDILRPHDDYGTQMNLLFSQEMWKNFFEENTKKLVKLAHKYGAFYQQHSCGAVSEIIPELINCGIDALEPLQKVKGMEIEFLKKEYGEKLCFHGGIDTQGLLPNGSVEEVEREVKLYNQILNQNGGYILMGSQGYESDIPLENIEAIYNSPRN